MNGGGMISLRPVIGSLAWKRNEPRFLFVTYYDPNGINTICEHIALWQRQSRFDLCNVNLSPNVGGGPLALPTEIDLRDFDGVIIHPTVSYNPNNIIGLDRRLKTSFEEFDGVKVLLKQDEQVLTGMVSTFLAEKKFDILVSCVPEAEIEKAYEPEVVREIDVLHVLTGYVSDHQRALKPRAYGERTVDIAYRGSLQPLEFGRLGYEKRQIGYEVAAAVAGRPITTDISSLFEDRIGGDAWFNFLGNGRIILGAESGSNLFDFDGSVTKWCRAYERRYGAHSPGDADFYLKAHDEFLHSYEGNVNYAQVSPRHFEAAATRSVQLLYEGEYSDIFIPDRHFLALKRDLSNLDECLEILRDEKRANELTDAAFEEIIMDDAFGYDRFIQRIDQVIENRLSEKKPGRCAMTGESITDSTSGGAVNGSAMPSAAKTKRPRALLVMAHEPLLDPRIEWVASGLEDQGYEVVELGFYRWDGERPASIEQVSAHRSRVRVERMHHDQPAVRAPWMLGDELGVGERIILTYGAYMNLPLDALARKVGAYGMSAEKFAVFRSQCAFFFHTNNALLEAARRIGQFDAVIAADLDSMPSALALTDGNPSLACYDAHEYWPGAYAKAAWENEFWAHLEHQLVNAADLCMTVSPPLAKHMTAEYGREFLYVPNCETMARSDSWAVRSPGQDKQARTTTTFLFQGNFSPDRPVDFLIKHWHQTPDEAILLLRGPDRPHKQVLIDQAKETGLLNSRIFFPEPVKEHDLIEAAADADVGIIPYNPYENMNYDYACPNKFSQYMAAGLPILASSIKFVAETVETEELGLTYDLKKPETLIHAVKTMTGNHALLKACSERSRAYFDQHFHWEVTSKPFYDALGKRLGERGDDGKTSQMALDFSWIPEPRPQPAAADAVRAIGKTESGRKARHFLARSKPIIKDVLPPFVARFAARSMHRFRSYIDHS